MNDVLAIDPGLATGACLVRPEGTQLLSNQHLRVPDQRVLSGTLLKHALDQNEVLNSTPRDGQVFIYALAEADYTIRYIGKTKRQIRKRLNQHCFVARERQRTERSHLQAWLCSLPSKPFVAVLGVFDEDEWEDAERAWIFTLKACGADLVNATDGGQGTRSKTLSPKHIERIRAAATGKKRSAEAIEATAQAHRGKKRSALTRQRIRDARKDYKWSEHQRQSVAALRSCVLCQAGPFTGRGMGNHRRRCS